MQQKSKKLILEKIENNKYICSSLSYSFLGEGTTPEKAIQSYEKQEKIYLNKLKKYQLKDIQVNNNDFNNSINLNSKFSWPNEILLHFTKTLITLILIITIIAFGLIKVSESLSENIEKNMITLQNEIRNLSQTLEYQIKSVVKGKDTDISLGDKIEKEINRGAEQEDISPERKERIIKNLEITAERYKPYIDAIKKLFSD